MDEGARNKALASDPAYQMAWDLSRAQRNDFPSYIKAIQDPSFPQTFLNAKEKKEFGDKLKQIVSSPASGIPPRETPTAPPRIDIKIPSTPNGQPVSGAALTSDLIREFLKQPGLTPAYVGQYKAMLPPADHKKFDEALIAHNADEQKKTAAPKAEPKKEPAASPAIPTTEIPAKPGNPPKPSTPNPRNVTVSTPLSGGKRETSNVPPIVADILETIVGSIEIEYRSKKINAAERDKKISAAHKRFAQ
jgi:hypothetical protein